MFFFSFQCGLLKLIPIKLKCFFFRRRSKDVCFFKLGSCFWWSICGNFMFIFSFYKNIYFGMHCAYMIICLLYQRFLSLERCKDKRMLSSKMAFRGLSWLEIIHHFPNLKFSRFGKWCIVTSRFIQNCPKPHKVRNELTPYWI